MATRSKPLAPSPFNALVQARQQRAEEHLDIQTSKHLDIQPSPKGAKSTDPEYVKFTTYIRKTTHRAVKMKALQQERELSDLVEQLLADWLKK